MHIEIPTETSTFTLIDADILAMMAHSKAIVHETYITGRKRHLISAVIWVSMSFSILELFKLYRNNSAQGSQVSFILIGIFVFLIASAIKKAMMTKMEINSFCDDEGWFKQEQTITTSDDNIRIESELSQSVYDWYSFVSFIEDDERVMIGAGVGPCIVIPKNIGISGDRIDWIRSLLITRSENMNDQVKE